MAEFAGAQDSGEVSFYERDAATFHGDVGAGAHGDADVGLGECGRVVDTVAGHGDDSSLLLQFLHHFGFSFGQNFGLEFVSLQAQLVRHGCSRGAAVSREHHDVDPLASQAAQYIGRRGLDGISHRKAACISAVNRNGRFVHRRR